MNPKHLKLSLLVVTGLLPVAALIAQSADRPPSGSSPGTQQLPAARAVTPTKPILTSPSATLPAPKPQTALRRSRQIHIDPETGKISKPPQAKPGGAIPQPLPADVNTSDVGLQEVPVRVRGGGMKLHLQGRFRCTAVATIGADGKVSTKYISSDAPEAEPHAHPGSHRSKVHTAEQHPNR